MRFTRLVLENWRNFRHVEVPLAQRMFVVGANASGKSNLLDALRFLRDIAEPQGGLRRAVDSPRRRGVSQLRSLHARARSNVVVEVTVGDDESPSSWRYRLEFGQDNQRRPLVKSERVWRQGSPVLERPLPEDDERLLMQTHLEQVSANGQFSELARFLAGVRYLHLVPQLVRDPERPTDRPEDPFGSDFLDRLAKVNTRTREPRLRRILSAVQAAVPQFKELKLERDASGVPHLLALHSHWRPDAGWQQEEQLSDGTLRLIGLLWALLDGEQPLLLEEPELSLHPAVVRRIPHMLAQVTRGRGGRQVLVSTHSADLLDDLGIGGESVIALRPVGEGTEVSLAANLADVRALLEAGLSVGAAVLPRVAPSSAHQLSLQL